MAGILDYYKQNPELFAENEYLLAKDPAYNLGLMDLGAMSFQERPRIDLGDKGYQPLTGILGGYLPETVSSNLDYYKERYGLEPGKIALYTGPFSKGDVPLEWSDPVAVPSTGWSIVDTSKKPLYNVDKARTIAHENRHLLSLKYPELYEAQPKWLGMTGDEDMWRDEAFNIFLDMRNYPDIRFRSDAAEYYPRGLSAVDLQAEDMYFDKIWRNRWEKKAKEYDKILKRIAGTTSGGTEITSGGIGPSKISIKTGDGKDGGGGGAPHISRSRDRGGLGISRSQAQSVREANKAAGMSGWRLSQGGFI